MGVSNYTPTGISHATSVDFSKRSVNQPVHIVQYDKSLPILAVSLYNNGQLYRLSEDMEVSIRLGKPDRTFVYNKALGCDSTRTIVYFEITQQMSLFDGEYYPVIEIMDGDKIANSSTIYLVVDRNPVQHDYIESTIEYKELINYRDEAVKAGKEAKESAKVAKESAQTVVDKTKEAVEAGQTAIDAANSASESAESILGVEENVTRIGNMVSEKEPIITSAAEVASTSATNARQSETNANASEEASKLSETNAKDSENKAKESEEASKLSETNAKESETNAKVSETNAKVSETNAKASVDSIEEIAKASESYAHGGTGTRDGEDTDNAKYWAQQAQHIAKFNPDGITIVADKNGVLSSSAEESLKEDSSLPPQSKAVAKELNELKDNIATFKPKSPIGKVYFNYGTYFAGSTFDESVNILSNYDLICCEGDISKWTDSDKRQNEMKLVQEVRKRNKNVKFFRYISVNSKYDSEKGERVPVNKHDMYQQIRATLHMGGTWTSDKDDDGYDIITGGIPYDGIFWDEFDSLAGITELNDGDTQSWESVVEKQNDLIEEARRLGICSFGNAWHVVELVSAKPIDGEPYYNPKSLPSSIGENDYLLVESCEFYPHEPIDGYGYWGGTDSSYKVFNYMQNYYQTQKANLVCFSSAGYSMTVEEKQYALTWMLFDALVMGGRYVCFDQGLIYDMPDIITKMYYKDPKSVTITKIADGNYKMLVNGHTIITKRESGLSGQKASLKSFKLSHIYIDGVEIKNAFAQSSDIECSFGEKIENLESTVETMAPDIKKNVSRYQRLMIDDWKPTKSPEAYPNMLPNTEGDASGISVSLNGNNLSGTVSNEWGSYRWTIDATPYRGKTIEIGCEKYIVSSTDKSKIGVVIYDGNDWGNRVTLYSSTNNQSDVGNKSGLNINYSVSEIQNIITFGIWAFGASKDDTFEIDGFYVIDPTSVEELLSKSDYTNRSIGFDSWVDSTSWSKPDDLTTLPYSITESGNDITIEYKEDGYSAYKGICVVMQTKGVLNPGSTWEIGCNSFESNAGDHIRIRAYVYSLKGFSSNIVPSKVDVSALYNVECPHITVTIPDTAVDADGCYVEILNVSNTPYITKSDGTKETHKAVIKGFYIYDVNEENVIIRGVTPANTWLQICRVKDELLVEDTKLVSNALYITDSGKMFITDFGGNRIDLIS